MSVGPARARNGERQDVKPLLCALLLTGCLADYLFLPQGGSYFTPPPEYAVWWREIQDCSGLRGELSAIGFSRVPVDTLGAFRCDRMGPWTRVERVHGLCLGAWLPPHQIWLSESAWMDRWIVQHEMLHDLIQSPEHPVEFFSRCPLPGRLSDAATGNRLP